MSPLSLSLPATHPEYLAMTVVAATVVVTCFCIYTSCLDIFSIRSTNPWTTKTAQLFTHHHARRHTNLPLRCQSLQASWIQWLFCYRGSYDISDSQSDGNCREIVNTCAGDVSLSNSHPCDTDDVCNPETYVKWRPNEEGDICGIKRQPIAHIPQQWIKLSSARWIDTVSIERVAIPQVQPNISNKAASITTATPTPATTPTKNSSISSSSPRVKSSISHCVNGRTPQSRSHMEADPLGNDALKTVANNTTDSVEATVRQCTSHPLPTTDTHCMEDLVVHSTPTTYSMAVLPNILVPATQGLASDILLIPSTCTCKKDPTISLVPVISTYDITPRIDTHPLLHAAYFIDTLVEFTLGVTAVICVTLALTIKIGVEAALGCNEMPKRSEESRYIQVFMEQQAWQDELDRRIARARRIIDAEETALIALDTPA
ncbi:hypothetical protein BASA60_008985 [Batrachochytrium salamandrivorans]|nr:hypothetical protein BASA60_008985 [Batrachochytrium salamandrivorans]KAH9255862.1 hypothetical protein BASA81_006036 [Batrachochytrium salamandrivorans]